MRFCAFFLPKTAPQCDSGDVSNLVAPIPFLVLQLFSGEGVTKGGLKMGKIRFSRGRKEQIATTLLSSVNSTHFLPSLGEEVVSLIHPF